MKDKYILEKFPRWMIFGENKETGLVDVADTRGDIISGIPREAAQRLIDEHNRVVDALVEEIMNQHLDKAVRPE